MERLYLDEKLRIYLKENTFLKLNSHYNVDLMRKETINF